MNNPIANYLRGFASEARAELRSNGGAKIDLDWRTVGVLVVSSILLALFYYYGRPGFYRRGPIEQFLAGWLNLDASVYRSLIPYGCWAAASLVLRVLIPLGCIVWWFKQSPKAYGFRLWKKGHAWIYLILYLLMLPVLVGVSMMESFQSKYPFYDQATDSLTHFLIYELAYGIQFFSLEAFFRGFMIFALFKKFGYYSVVIMTIPYCMIHFGKPMPETIGAIFAGLLLGYLAIQSRSWIPGAFLHWGVGITMDLLATIQKTGWPQ